MRRGGRLESRYRFKRAYGAEGAVPRIGRMPGCWDWWGFPPTRPSRAVEKFGVKELYRDDPVDPWWY